MKSQTMQGGLVDSSAGLALMCHEGGTLLVTDLLKQAGVQGKQVEIEFVDGALVIRRQGAFDGIPKNRGELVATLLACQFFRGRWVAVAERGVTLTGPFESADAQLEASGDEIIIRVMRNDDGSSGFIPKDELPRLAEQSGVARNTPVRVFFFGSGSHGDGVGIWVQPILEPSQ